MAAPQPQSASTGGGTLPKARVEALCDGVFAIAMTLMIFNIKVPALLHPQGGALAQALRALWPQFLVYAISFIMLGVYWVGHHAQFHYIHGSNRTLLWLNVAFLMLVSVIPFSTAVLGRYPGERTAVIFYASNLILTGTMLYLQWEYATRRHRLVAASLDPRLVAMAKWRTLMGPTLLLVAIAAAFVKPQLGLALCAAVPVFYILPGRIDRHWAPHSKT